MKLTSFYYSLIFSLLAYSANSFANNNWPSVLVNECNTPASGWIWCDDFEIDRSSDYFEGSADRQASMGVNGSVAGAFQFVEGSQGGGGMKIAFGRTPSSYIRAVDDGTRDYRDVYWRMFVYLPENWVGNGADKLSRAMIMAAGDWSQAMIAHVWSGADPGDRSDLLLLDPASGTDIYGNLVTSGYNDFANLRWLGIMPSTFAVFAAENFGQWHCVEAHAKLNDPGQSNGIVQLLINNNLEAESTTLNWIGSYDAYGINAVFFENYWNNGSPVTQIRYFDNLVISTEPIGCGTITLPPVPPKGLAVPK